MLMSCPECHHDVSDKAAFCPSCGYPMGKRVSTSKVKRLPNGFGSITKRKGHLRRPYLARITISKTDTGRPILKSLGYYSCYNDAYAALIEYNKNPYDLTHVLTVKDTYAAFESEFDKEDHSTGYINAVKRAYTQSEALYDIPMRNIRPRHIKLALEAVTGSHAKANYKNFWNRLFDFAVANEIVDHNYARDFKLDPETAKNITMYKQPHLTFSNNEMSTLWKSQQEVTAKMILIQSFTGWRPDELCNLKLEDINLGSWSMKGGMKTEAGTGRVIPIHSAVRLLVSEQYKKQKESGSKYLFELNYNQYHYQFKKFIKSHGLDARHRPHDPRKQFATMAAKSGVDPMAIKRILGHRISDITEAVYTERDLEWLRRDIEKIDAQMYK